MPPPSLPTKQERGRQAEDDALAYLLLQGLVLLQRNYLCRGGELDLIMRDGASVVFVEVRLRSGSAFGGALASITPAKQRRIALAAQHYLSMTGKHGDDCRFDCILLDGKDIEWIRDAFSAE